ncbi:hypothetical protein CHH27_17860 [Labrenzia sp. VG12]|nr:hypothetical protein CHH27_17860 [Labrenzia sp. VG12]
MLLFVFIFDALIFVSLYFQMPLAMLLDSLRYAGNLSVMQSLLYLGVGMALACSFWMTFQTVRKLSRCRHKIRLAPFAIVLLGFVAVDWWINLTPQKSMGFAAQFTERFVPVDDAASIHSELASRLDQPRQPNVLVVMVEGLGAFQSDRKQELVWEPLLSEQVKQAYEIKSGTTRYFGSTTSGEARELCNLKADYRDFRDRKGADCLPGQALEAGYRTAAFHAFTQTFFERVDWFPKIGFQELYFLENNAGLPPGDARRHCGLTFRGLCDGDVAEAVKAYLAEDGGEPKFVYWLTLNSHKPVQPGEVPARLSCEDGGVFEDRELCLMSEQWLNVSHLVRDMALSDSIGDTEILLVGDHHPPLFTRSGREQFQPDKVAWLHLSPKRSSKTLTASMSAAAPDF